MLCHIVVLGCPRCVGNCVTTGFLNKIVLVLGICSLNTPIVADFKLSAL